MTAPEVILDTNVFIAAAFRPGSDSALVLRRVRDGAIRLVWSDPTRRETEALLRKIPPLSWDAVASLFTAQGRFDRALEPDAFPGVPDPDDRKFAALAAASGATLVSLDRHLLEAGDAFSVSTPSRFLRQHGWNHRRENP